MTRLACARWALAAYPKWWRARYGQDQESFLEDLAGDGRSMTLAAVSLLWGALRLRLEPVGMPAEAALWRDRTRTSVAFATLPALGTLWLADVIGSHSSPDFIQGQVPLAVAGRVATDATRILSLVSLGLVVLLAIGWFLVGRLATRVPRGKEGRRWMCLYLAPLAAIVMEACIGVVQSSLEHGKAAGTRTVVVSAHPLVVTLLGVAHNVVGFAGLASVACVVIAARTAKVTVPDLRGGVLISLLTAVMLSFTTVVALAWGIGVSHQAPVPTADLSGSGPGLHPWSGVLTSIAPEWPLVVAAMAICALVAALAARAAQRSYRMATGLVAGG